MVTLNVQRGGKLSGHERINRVRFRDNKPGSLEASGDQNPGQWCILKLYVSASHKTEMPEKP